MTPEMQKYIELLESQLGYSEKSDAYTKFGDWYGKNVEFDADYSSAPWCDMYLSWAAHKLGYEEWIGQFAWTVAHAKWFKEQGAWGKTPKPGAIVFYDWGGSNDIDNIDHVGIVTKVEGGTIHTIEGNIDGGVAKRKERETGKVVGYGYPQRIKDRLDEAKAQKKAEEEASRIEPGTESGTLQESGESLSTLIPRTDTGPSEQDRVLALGPGKQTRSKGQTEGQTPEEAQGRPRASTPDTESRSESRSEPAPKKGSTRPESTSQSGTATKSPQATASPSTGAAKKGKHAAPATAGTEEATTEPLPTITDASATGPLPAIDSPTLVGSALIAALALLAVVKTRRLRLSPAAVPAVKTPRPSRAKGRRRRRRTAEIPVTATAHSGRPLDPAEPRKLPLTRPFDLATDAPRHAAPGRRHAPHRHAAGTSEYAPAFDAEPFGPDFDRARFTFTDETGPLERLTFTDETGPFERLGFGDETGPLEVVLDTGPLQRFVDTGPFERIVIPGASSAFDAFAPPRSRGGDAPETNPAYRGRRRRLSAEEHTRAAFSLDPTPRGRRHRHTGVEPFPIDAQARGRRHRRPHAEDEQRLAGAGRGRHRA